MLIYHNTKEGFINDVKGELLVDSIRESYNTKIRKVNYQAWTYASYIRDYNEEIYSNDTQLSPCSYLHNYKLENRYALLDETYAYYV